MRRMTLRGLIHDERGANAVLIAFLLVPMMGFGALAIDVSAQHAEKAQLQRGADAAALGVAAACADGETNCGSRGTGYFNANSGTPVQGDPSVVVTMPTASEPGEVVVVGEATFPHMFASLVDNDSDPNNTRVRAQSTAQWGMPLGAGTLPLAFPLCKFDDFTPNPDTGLGTEIWVRNDIDARKKSDCANLTEESYFGWLSSTTCSAEVELTDTTPPEAWVPADPGKSPLGAGCSESYFVSLEESATPVLVPVYDEVGDKKSDGSGKFHLVAFASFIVTGWDFPGWNASPPGKCKAETGAPSCSGIRGYFTDLIPVEDVIGELGGMPPLPGLPIVWKLTG